MRVVLLCVGKTGGSLGAAVSEYEERVRRYWRFETVEVEAGAGKGRKGDPEAVKRAEGERILRQLPEGGERRRRLLERSAAPLVVGG